MKKTNFWKALALAAIALVSVSTTSCSEEELKIEGSDVNCEIPELANPVAQVAVTVLNYENGEVLSYEVKDISDNIGGSYTVDCPKLDGYTQVQSKTFNVASIQKGQVVVYPVTFYVVPLGSALEDLIAELYPGVEGDQKLPVDPTTDAKVETLEVTAKGDLAIDENGVITNEGTDPVQMELSIPYKSGYEYAGTESRSISASDIMRLQAVTKIFKMTITVMPQSAVTITATQVVTPVILTVDGVDYKLWYYEDLKVDTAVELLTHGHGHGHGHGTGNAGGGITEAE